MQASQFPLEADSYLASVLPQASAAWEALGQNEGRNDPASLAATRAVLLKAAPWLVLLFWTVLTVAFFRG